MPFGVTQEAYDALPPTGQRWVKYRTYGIMSLICGIPIFLIYCTQSFTNLRETDNIRVLIPCGTISGLFSFITFIYSVKTTAPEQWKSKTHGNYFQFFLALASLSMAIIYPSYLFLNSKLDRSSLAIHQVIISRMHSFEGVRSSSHDLYFPDWDDETRHLRLSVGRKFYSNINIGDSLEIVTGKGAFGVEWVKNYKLPEP